MKINVFIGPHLYSLTQFSNLSLEKQTQWLKPAQAFIKSWLNGQKTFQIHTSGSTGKPKLISHSRNQLIVSAKATIQTLKLSKGTKALVCLNTSFIGGQMMLMRAIYGEWDIEIVEPSSDPSLDATLEYYDFIALAPIQVSTLLETDRGKSLLNNAGKVIIGGAPISKELLSQIQALKCTCYHTYGMTETVSHIALKKLNGLDRSDWFETIGDNQIALDERGCLRVKGSVTNDHWVTTNDLVQIDSGRFKWLGRADFTVNSGGVKIQIEEAETFLNKLLEPYFEDQVILWKRPSKRMGEALIGMSNNQEIIDYLNSEPVKLKEQLPPYHFPKTWFYVTDFVYNESGKIDRNATYQLMKS